MLKVSAVRSVLLLLFACLLTTGCTPAGQNVRVGHWEATLPTSWQATEVTPGGKWVKAWKGDGVKIQFTETYSQSPYASATLNDFAFGATLGLTDYKAQPKEPLTIQGAREGAMIRYTFTDGGTPRAGAWIAGSQWPNPEASVISISTESGPLDSLTLQKIVDSLRWHA